MQAGNKLYRAYHKRSRYIRATHTRTFELRIGEISLPLASMQIAPSSDGHCSGGMTVYAVGASDGRIDGSCVGTGDGAGLGSLGDRVGAALGAGVGSNSTHVALAWQKHGFALSSGRYMWWCAGSRDSRDDLPPCARGEGEGPARRTLTRDRFARARDRPRRAPRLGRVHAVLAVRVDPRVADRVARRGEQDVPPLEEDHQREHERAERPAPLARALALHEIAHEAGVFTARVGIARTLAQGGREWGHGCHGHQCTFR